MKSEIIFSYSSSWHGRYSDVHGIDIEILCDISNPTQWPFMIRKTQMDGEMFGEEERTTEITKISQSLFENIKTAIAKNSDLRKCTGKIDNEVMDGSSEYFRFACDGFVLCASGSSILGSGSYDDQQGRRNTENCIVYKAYEQVKALVQKEGIDVFEW